jgi:hypothetical protein
LLRLATYLRSLSFYSSFAILLPSVIDAGTPVRSVGLKQPIRAYRLGMRQLTAECKHSA